MNKRTAIRYVLAFCLLTGCGKNNEQVKIGAVLPLTGSAAVWGQNAKMGIELALKEINSAGGARDRKVDVLYEDSQSDPVKAVSSLGKLIDVDKVQMVIGDIASSNVLAMAPVAEKAKVVLLSPGASNPEITQAGEYIFRNWQSDALEGDLDARFAYNRLGWREISIVYVGNAYGTGLKTVFEKSFHLMGGKILTSEQFQQGATDLRSQLERIRRSNPHGIYMPGYPPEMAILLRESKELGINARFLSVQAFDDPQILQLAKGATEGVIFSVPEPPDTTNSIVNNFTMHYRTMFGKEPGVCSNTGYDALRILVWAINQGGYSGPEVQKQLLKLKDFPGAAGSTTFDENGDVIRPFIFKTVKDGQFVEFDRGR